MAIVSTKRRLRNLATGYPAAGLVGSVGGTVFGNPLVGMGVGLASRGAAQASGSAYGTPNTPYGEQLSVPPSARGVKAGAGGTSSPSNSFEEWMKTPEGQLAMGQLAAEGASGTRLSMPWQQVLGYQAAMQRPIDKYSAMAAGALNAAPNFQPGQFQAPFSLGKLNVGQFNADDPRFSRQAQAYATQAMREKLVAQGLARREFGDLYAGQREDVGFRRDEDLGGQQARGEQAWQRIQNMGANTGLGYGPMAQRNLLTQGATNQAAEAAIRRGYQNELAGYGRQYGTQMYGSYNQDALARSAREAEAINYLYQNILPAQTNAFTANANAATNAYGQNRGYLADLASQWDAYQGRMGDASQRGMSRAGSLADLYAGLIGPVQNVYSTGLAARMNRY